MNKPLVVELSDHRNLDPNETGCWATLLASGEDIDFLMEALCQLGPADIGREDRVRNRRIVSQLSRARMEFRNQRLPDLPDGYYLIEQPTTVRKGDKVLYHAKGAWVAPESAALSFCWPTTCYIAVTRRKEI